MKSLILVISTFIFSAPLFAKDTQVIADISLKNGSVFYRYTLVKENEKSAFKLVFQEKQKKPVAKVVSNSQAEFIKNEATRIIWKSEYLKPKNIQRCSEYVNIRSGTEKTTVCAENRQATGMTYGLLNTISHIFDTK